MCCCKPVDAFIAGVATTSEIQHPVQELRTAKAVIVPDPGNSRSRIRDSAGPEFQTVLQNTRLVFKETYFISL